MRWFALYNKIGKQPINIIRKSDVIGVFEGEEVKLLLKFKPDGSPYLISREEFNYNQCKECFNYNIGDGYDDILVCKKCNYYSK